MQGALDLYSSGKLAILQNVGYPNPVLSHFRGTDIWHTSTDSDLSFGTGWIGRLLSQLYPTYPPSSITPGSQPLAIQFGNSLYNLFLSRNGGMGISINQVPTSANGSVHNYDALPSNPLLSDNELGYVRFIQSETEVYAQSIVARSIQKNKTVYPGTDFGAQMAGVAQLIASGFSTKIYLVTLAGFDTHSNQLQIQPGLIGELSDTMKAFQADLEAFGVADHVSTMTYSEFGRRVAENGSGTDHGTAAPLFVFGTQVIGGFRGHDPKLDSASLVQGNLVFDSRYDFRNVYATVMSEWLGIDDTTILDVLTASNGETYSATTNWTKLGIFKGSQGVVDSSELTPGLMLLENYPNPVYSETTIEYTIPESMPVELGIFTEGGVEVARIVDSRQAAGIYQLQFKPGSLSAGTYIYRLSTPKGNIAKRMTVLK